MKQLIALIIGLFLAQDVLASASDPVFAYCGTTVVCQWDHKCEMIDGDYGLFKPFVVGNPFPSGTYKLNDVLIRSAVHSSNKQFVQCNYSTNRPGQVVQYNYSGDNHFFLTVRAPISDGWVYKREGKDTPGDVVSWTCDAKKFECRMENY